MSNMEQYSWKMDRLADVLEHVVRLSTDNKRKI